MSEIHKDEADRRADEFGAAHVIVRVGADGGDITLYGYETAGGWIFRRTLIDQSAILLEEPTTQHDSETAYSWEDAIRLLDKYPWRRLYPLTVHLPFRARVWEEISKLVEAGLLHESRIDDWRKICEDLKSDTPSKEDIAELVGFRSRLYVPGFKPIEKWSSWVDKDGGGARQLSWPEYNDAVTEFFSAASQRWWNDSEYQPEQASKMIADPSVIANASLQEIKTMLTYCVRGERFNSGHWGAMIEQGHIERLLLRLETLQNDSEMGTP